MYEAIPVALGALFAIALFRFQRDNTRLRAALTAALSLLVGFAVASATGELAESWAFGLFDAAQFALASVVTFELAKRYAASQIR